VRGTTEGINLIAKSWGLQNISEGDEIIITWLKHAMQTLFRGSNCVKPQVLF
jgi:selenocysteine lyase/cysteine desulfurase